MPFDRLLTQAVFLLQWFATLSRKTQSDKRMTTMNVTVNETQRLFVIPVSGGGGYSCLGFDVVYKRLQQYVKKLGWGEPSAEEIGTLDQYNAFKKAEHAYILTKPEETQFDPDTPLIVQKLLDSLIKQNVKVRIYYGDAKTGRDWLNEYDIIGRISRSMGPLKVPLLVPERGNGGFAILTACIVRIQASNGQDLWKHASYHQPKLTIRASDKTGYLEEVLVDDTVLARFKKAGHAERWKAFVQGNRFSK